MLALVSVSKPNRAVVMCVLALACLKTINTSGASEVYCGLPLISIKTRVSNLATKC